MIQHFFMIKSFNKLKIEIEEHFLYFMKNICKPHNGGKLKALSLTPGTNKKEPLITTLQYCTRCPN